MDLITATLGNTLNDSNNMLLSLLVFLAVGTMAFATMAFVRARGGVKRRALGIADEGTAKPSRNLRYSSLKAMAQLVEYTTRHYSETNADSTKVLRGRLIRAGVYDPRGIAFFFIARTALAVGLAAAVFVFLPLV